ncbi:hypothetical protein FRC01_014489 [Tulasnella sp. 417]|nr:hypothetical protein FRC01_014489 [Tulasnella sp. 417]
MLDMSQIVGFHHQVDILGRLAENIGRGMAINRRTMQSAEIEMMDMDRRIAAHQSGGGPAPESEARRLRLRTAYSNMARSAREARSAFLDAERSLLRSRRELEAVMGAAGLEQATSRAAEDMAAARARVNSNAASSFVNPARAAGRPVSMYDGFLGGGSGRREDNGESSLREQLRMFEEQTLAAIAGEPSAGSAPTTANAGASGASGSGNGLNPMSARARRALVPQRSATSAPSTSTPAVNVEHVPERASQLRERAAEGWSPLQISAFVPPPSPPRPLSRLRPASRYSTIDPYWIREDSVESMDEFNFDDLG